MLHVKLADFWSGQRELKSYNMQMISNGNIQYIVVFRR